MLQFPAFPRIGGVLHCGASSVEDIAREVGTPLYIYNLDSIVGRLRHYTGAFETLPHTTCYAVKANSTGAVLRALVRAGAGFDVNSRGELFRALRAGADPLRITMTGVAKTDADIDDALAAGILYFNAESAEECARIDALAARQDLHASVLLRINPNVDAHTHPYIATGLAEHKFGLSGNDALEAVKQFRGLPHVSLDGFGMHLGSQIFDPAVFVEGLDRMLDFIDSIAAELSAPLRVLNIGGGIGVPYAEDETAVAPADVARAIAASFERARRSSWAHPDGLRLVSEPGRYIVANEGILVTRVEYIKRSGERNFLLLDAGMNDLIRPALYEAYHHVVPVIERHGGGEATYDIAGPVCESGDTFALARRMAAVKAGDLVAIHSAGAYGAAMSSIYNSRPFAAEVAVQGGSWFIARSRQSLDQIIENETTG